jgi:hypothetical protein
MLIEKTLYIKVLHISTVSWLYKEKNVNRINRKNVVHKSIPHKINNIVHIANIVNNFFNAKFVRELYVEQKREQ